MSSRKYQKRRNTSPTVEKLRHDGATRGEIEAAQRAAADARLAARPSPEQRRHAIERARSSATTPDDRLNRHSRGRRAQRESAKNEWN